LSLMLAVSVWGVFVGLRYAGWLQHLELFTYDGLMKTRGQDNRSEPPITVVAVTEADIQKFGQYPVSDEDMAVMLSRIESHGAKAIGVDIFRDVPQPKVAHLTTQPAASADERDLNKVLRDKGNIVVIYRAEERGRAGVNPPPVLLHEPNKDGWQDDDLRDQIGFSDPFLPDADDVTRRFTLFLPNDHAREQLSFDLRLVFAYLGDDVKFQMAAGPRQPIEFGAGHIEKLLGNEGGYAHASGGGYQLLFDGRAPDHFRTVSADDVIQGRAGDSDFKGRIVLIGMTSESTKDLLNTSFREKEYGINAHAMVIDQLLRIVRQGDKPIAVWPKPWESAWILLWSVGGAALGLFVRSVWKFAVGVVAGLALLGVIVFLSFRHNLWLPSVPPAFAWFSSAALVTSYISYREEKDRGTIMQLFSRHVSTAVAETIWQQRDAFFEGGRLRPRRAVATVLFTDLRGFSTLSEHADPSELMDWMNEYMSAMTAAVERHRGVVMKYIGDSVMAVFGIPLLSDEPADHAEEARRAVSAAVAMREELTRLNAGWRAAGKRQATMRVGVHTGPLVVGSLGSADRLEYACLGDTVNVASRLESYDKDLMGEMAPGNCRILISQSTAELLGGRFATFPLGEGKLHGRGDAMSIYAVLGRAGAEVTSVAAAGS